MSPFKHSKIATVGIILITALSACERVRTTEIAIELKNYGREVNVDIEPGIKCIAPCWFGHEFIQFPKSQEEIRLIAVDPRRRNTEVTVHGRSAFGLIQTKEQLPMEGAISIFVRLDLSESNKSELENLYRKIPLKKKEGEEEPEYRDRVFGRLALYALSAAQDYYETEEVKDVLKNRTRKETALEELIEQIFAAEGLGFVKVDKVSVATLNRGPDAEDANRRFALVGIDKRIAEEQRAIATTIAETSAIYAEISAQVLSLLVAAGVGDQSLDSALCIHNYIYNKEFAARYDGTCFDGISLGGD